MAAPPGNTGAAAAVHPPPAMPHGNITEILPSLPIETRRPRFQLRQYNGFWLPEKVLTDIPAIHARFEARPSDIFLASFPKSGTTWLKAFAFATQNRATHSPFDNEHPLHRNNPHDCVRFIEMDSMLKGDVEINITLDELEALRSPRLLSTHLPYSLLPEGMTGEASRSRVVYICRNPKDALISEWFFINRLVPTDGINARSYTLQEGFQLFCEGRSFFGPHWQHALQYWSESLRRPDKVLFLRYEEMLREPRSHLKKLAKFMGCEFSREEEDGGVVDAIVKLCSLPKLKNMEVNRNESNYLAVKNETYFRKGVIGDWSNHLTPEMAKKLDKIVEGALQGSGLTFADGL